MANPDYANVSDADLHNGHRYNVLVSADAVQSQPGPVFHAHVRHPFPFSAVPGQLPAAGFPQSANADYRPPAATVPGNPANVYDGGFNPSPFIQQFPSEQLNDGNVPPYQTNVDAVRPPAGAPFDNFSSLFGMVPPMCAGNSPKFYASCQPVGYPSPSPSFMSRADGAGFGNQLQSSASSSSSQPWPPPPNLHRPPFGQLSRIQQLPSESTVDDFCGTFLPNSTVGSDSLSSGSPVAELVDHGNSPTHLPGATYSCAMTLPSPSMSDVVESVRRAAATSPFCPSPIDGLQISRSLPAGVRFGSPHSGSSVTAVGHHHAVSRMNFDSTSPATHRSFYQPGSVLGGLEDRTAVGAGFQVESCL